MAQETLTISRGAPSQPWGFRLQGGKDFNMPIIIQKVNGGSPAERAGLRAGDAVLSIGGRDAIEMRHKEAQDAIVGSGNNINMIVQRGGLASLRLPPSAQSVPKNLETTDGTVKALVHNQFNSPMPLYSEEKIAETLSAQTEVLAGGALGVDFRKNEKKFDGNMSEVLRMVQDMDQQPAAYQDPPEEADAPLPADYTGLNSIKSRAMKSLVVKPDGQGGAQPTSAVHAPRIAAPSQHKIPPPVAPKPAAAQQQAPPARGPPGLRSTSATLIRTDPASGTAKIVTAVDTEVKHFNAFNRTPQSFKPMSSGPTYQPISAPPPPAPMAPAPAPAPMAPAPVVPGAPKQPLYPAGSSGLSSVDYTSYVPQRKGGTTFAWPPKPTETDSVPPFGGHVEINHPAPAPAPAPAAPKPAPPPVLPKPAAPSFAPAPAPPKQVHFGQPSFAPAVAPKPAPAAPSIGGGPKLGFNGGLPGLSSALGVGSGLGAGGTGGKGSTAGRTQAPRRGRGQLNPAATAGSRIPHCHTCNNQIRGPFITALGQCWCPGCFVCATPQCRQSLEHVGFVELDDQIHCENCWESHLAPVCFKCQRRIKGDCLKAIGKAYHPECFACAYCGGLFGNSAFFLEDGLPYCENDWNELFTTKCVGCGFPIEAGDRWVEALNKNFHSQCFKCAICGNNLEGQSFFAKQGRPFCKHHARM